MREHSHASMVAMAGEDALRAGGDCLTLAVATDAGVTASARRIGSPRG
ncbi:hypothetical protein ACH4T9_14900 [Micromonospora sp. NPDC020750]